MEATRADARPEGRTNRLVATLLRSPLHRLLSSRVCLVRYVGRRSGMTFVTPVQYVERGDEVLVLVGRPDSKSWWRNFEGGGHDVEVLVRGQWRSLRGCVVAGDVDPDAARAALVGYLERFPSAGRVLEGETVEDKARSATFVICSPR